MSRICTRAHRDYACSTLSLPLFSSLSVHGPRLHRCVCMGLCVCYVWNGPFRCVSLDALESATLRQSFSPRISPSFHAFSKLSSDRRPPLQVSERPKPINFPFSGKIAGNRAAKRRRVYNVYTPLFPSRTRSLVRSQCLCVCLRTVAEQQQ